MALVTPCHQAAGRAQRLGRIARRLSVLLASAASLLACRDQPVLSARPPAIEFLVASGDSTFWVRADADGIRVRSGPLLLTQVEERLYQLSIDEEITDFLDAEFVSERLIASVLGEEDSVVLLQDESVFAARDRWRQAHPGEEPIDLMEEDAPDPESSATDFLEVITVHGPFVSWAHALDIDLTPDTGHRHERRRGVSDIRTGARMALTDLVSHAEARRLESAGRASLDTVLEVVRQAADERAARARSTLESFAFDTLSFTLTDVGLQPAITFHVGGTSATGDALELLLPPLVLHESPVWWERVTSTLPVWSADSLTVEWSAGAARVLGTVDSARTRIALELIDMQQPDAQRSGHRWPIAVVPMPTYQFLSLDSLTFGPRQRQALLDAFEYAADGDPFATRATWSPPRSRRDRLESFLRFVQNP